MLTHTLTCKTGHGKILTHTYWVPILLTQSLCRLTWNSYMQNVFLLPPWQRLITVSRFIGKISQVCSSQVHKHTLTPILFYSFYRDIYLISVYSLTLWGDPIIWIKWKRQSVFQQKGGKSYIVHESTYKYKCLWGHHLWSCTCINQCSLSECHCVFLFLCEFLLPGVMFLKPGQPFTPTREQGQAYPWAPMCVVMCVCIYSNAQVHNSLTSPLCFFIIVLILYVDALLCL